MRILLLEPGYKNKYPSLGLMKLATFHQGDEVYFRKGKIKKEDPTIYDRVYISTLFTFEYKKSIEAIEYAKKLVRDPKRDIYVGGVAATLLREEFQKLGVKVVPGLLTSCEMIDCEPRLIDGELISNIDLLTPNYNIIKEVDIEQYKYPVNDAYIAYATRGCKNNCKFCAVNTIEPDYIGYVPFKAQIEKVISMYGERKDLILMDNNVFASDYFFEIIDEIKELGFKKGDVFNSSPNKIKPRRYVDFNQGLDARFVTPEKMKKLSEISINPVRIAFDNIKYRKIYENAIRLAAQNGITNLSNYILYNFEDTPEDFYQRLKINIDLNRELGTKIYSFPMKYIPLNNLNRKYIGKNWTIKKLRGVQCILNATMGKVGPKQEFFIAAFGASEEEFKEIIMMPEQYIIYRNEYKDNAFKWKEQYRELNEAQKNELDNLTNVSKLNKEIFQLTDDIMLKELLKHYI